MSDTTLDILLSQILSANNVQRAAAEEELGRRGREVPGFCTSLAHHSRALLATPSTHAIALVALATLKRSLAASEHADELQHVISVLLAHLGDVAVLPGGAVAAMRQWSSSIVVAVRRLAVLVASAAAAPDTGAATVDAIMTQLLDAFAQRPGADARGLASIASHVWLLQTVFEEPIPEAMHLWCSELLLGCAPPLFALLCDAASATLSTTSLPPAAATAEATEVQARCSLLSLTAETLCVLYGWQFTSTGRARFPAALKQHFLTACPLLHSFICAPCTHWLSVCAADTATAAGLAAAALSTLELVSSVLQLGGWYKRCVSAQLLQDLLQSLDADAPSYAAALSTSSDEEAGEAAGNGWMGCLLSGSSGGGDGGGAATARWAAVVRRRSTQCWSLFRDAALLPFMKAGFVDVVGHRCGLQYYQLLLSYAALGPADVEVWLDDPNAFLRAEDEREDGVRWTTRDTVAQLYADSITTLGPLFLHASLEDLNERLFADVSCDGGRPAHTHGGGGDSCSASFAAPQQQREAALFMMETVLRHRARQLRECGAADFTQLATHLWGCDVAGASAHPGVTARALMLLVAIVRFTGAPPAAPVGAASAAATTASAVTAAIVAGSTRTLSVFTGTSTDVAGVAAAASPPTCTRLVAVLLCRVLHSTLPFWSETLLDCHSASWQASLLALLSPQAGLSEEALYSAVEQLADLLKAAQQKSRQSHGGASGGAAATSLVLPALPRAVMDCWRRHVSDPSFADAVLGLLRRVVRDSETGAPLLLQELPWINGVLSGYAESMAELCAVPYFLQLLRCVFKRAPDAVASGAAALMLDSLCQLLLCTEESAILGASSSCLAALLRRCPAVQSVQVRVVAATMEAAVLGGGGGAGDGSGSDAASTATVVADAPRSVYPFSTVIVAIVLRTLDDRRDEASLMEMGDALVAIMRQSTSFSEAELVRVIHATVNRLAVVRTDTVAQQLLAPLATLMLLHPVALVRTLAQGGVLVETMGRWLPQVEHFASLRTMVASCAGLLTLLSTLSQPAAPSALLTAEEAQQLAQQPVTCRWRLPEELTAGEKGTRKATRKGSGGDAAAAARRALLSSLKPGASVETTLPLYAGVLVGVGRGLLSLLAAPVTMLRRACRAVGGGGEAAACGLGAGAAGVASDEEEEDDDDGSANNGLFRDGSEEEEEEEWEEEEDAGDVDGDATPRPTEQHDAVATSGGGGDDAVTDRLRLLGSLAAQMLPWMRTHGGEVTAYFTPAEAETLMQFFALHTEVSPS
ncbi:hypothetical protein NESM_000039700 [Novymonas esmeraldas]|uniref:Uncharacterized protein n=1 Tax=Novymonas esmeraldas TaxID=1808958 RepID=A0AAW0F418_9TRYP